MTETTTGDLLRLTQWLSPAFPLGSFAYSHGLESVIAEAEIDDAAGFAEWLRAVLLSGSGRNDGLLVSLAHRAVLPDAELADLAAALAASLERWEETLAQGTAFAQTTNAILGTVVAPAAFPVVVGIQARRLGLPTVSVIALYLQSFAGNLVSVATRSVPLGQTAGQSVLDELQPEIAELAEGLAEAGPEDFSTATPRAELFSMRHETAEIRLYRS